jgi:4a-hydroxytetrahydrobiopterin dehydratase
MTDLTAKRCLPCEGGVAPMDAGEAAGMLGQLTDWILDEAGKEISREYTFKNYYQTMAFVNALAWIAHMEDHHPELRVGYNRVRVGYSTHSIGGLSENDFICAAKIDGLVPSP